MQITLDTAENLVQFMSLLVHGLGYYLRQVQGCHGGKEIVDRFIVPDSSMNALQVIPTSPPRPGPPTLAGRVLGNGDYLSERIGHNILLKTLSVQWQC